MSHLIGYRRNESNIGTSFGRQPATFYDMHKRTRPTIRDQFKKSSTRRTSKKNTGRTASRITIHNNQTTDPRNRSQIISNSKYNGNSSIYGKFKQSDKYSRNTTPYSTKNGNIVLNNSRGLKISNHSSNKSSKHSSKMYRIKSGEKSISNFSNKYNQNFSPVNPFGDSIPVATHINTTYRNNSRITKAYDKKYDKYKLNERSNHFEESRTQKRPTASEVANPLLFEMKRKEEYRKNESNNASTISKGRPTSPLKSQNIYIEKQKKSRSKRSRPESYKPNGQVRGLIGLQNIGNTCYMNSTLQCLLNTPGFADYFERADPYSLSGKFRIAKSFCKLVQELRSKKSGYLAPKDVKTSIARKTRRMAGFGQQDAQEFLVFFLEGLSEETNRVKGKPKYIELDYHENKSLKENSDE